MQGVFLNYITYIISYNHCAAHNQQAEISESAEGQTLLRRDHQDLSRHDVAELWVVFALFEDVHFSLGFKHIHGVEQDVLFGDASNFSLVLGEGSIVNGHYFISFRLGLTVEVESRGDLALKKVENGHSSIRFNGQQVNARSTCADIDHRVVQLNALGYEKITCFICASITCQIFIFPSSPAEIAKVGFRANDTL